MTTLIIIYSLLYWGCGLLAIALYPDRREVLWVVIAVLFGPFALWIALNARRRKKP